LEKVGPIMGSLKRVEKEPLSLHRKIIEELKLCINDRIPFQLVYDINNKLPNLLYRDIFTTNWNVYRQLKKENIDEAM
jgi:hypothetical protein